MDSEDKKFYGGGCLGMALMAVIAIVIIVFSSCTRTVYVPQTTIQRDSIYLTQYQKDSIYLHDSVFVKEKGDTIWLEKWHTKYIEKLRTDTMYVEHNDTIREAYPVEKQLSFSQKSFITLGKVSLGAIITAVLAFTIFLLFRKRSI